MLAADSSQVNSFMGITWPEGSHLDQSHTLSPEHPAFSNLLTWVYKTVASLSPSGRILKGHSRSRALIELSLCLCCVSIKVIFILYPILHPLVSHKSSFWNTGIEISSDIGLLFLPGRTDSSFISQNLLPALFLVQQQRTVFCKTLP